MSESNDNAYLILNAINDLREHVDSGFTTMDGRVRKVEEDITRVKTIGGVVGFTVPTLAFFGWSTVKAWLVTLIKS